MILLKNISKSRSVVCTLKDGTSLRLLPQSEVTIRDNQVTEYLESLSKMNKPVLVIRKQTESVNAKKGVEPKDNKASKKTLKQK